MPPTIEQNGRIVGILFADVVGFSKLSDTEVVRFCYEFLSRVGRLLANAPKPPLVRNTWGDGLYLAFSKVSEAGTFALALRDLVADTDWAALQLPSGLQVRIGVHAGPVVELVDGVTGQLALSGKHVVRAARVEPITPPGMVYATREFAALAMAYDVKEFVCESVGRVRLAKTAGEAPLFVVRRSLAAERS